MDPNLKTRGPKSKFGVQMENFGNNRLNQRETGHTVFNMFWNLLTLSEYGMRNSIKKLLIESKFARSAKNFLNFGIKLEILSKF